MFLTLNDIRAIAMDLAAHIAADWEDYQGFVSVEGGYVTNDNWDEPISLIVEADGTIIQH